MVHLSPAVLEGRASADDIDLEAIDAVMNDDDQIDMDDMKDALSEAVEIDPVAKQTGPTAAAPSKAVSVEEQKVPKADLANPEPEASQSQATVVAKPKKRVQFSEPEPQYQAAIGLDT